MARLTGLEPATPGVTGRYSNQLSYNRAMECLFMTHFADRQAPIQRLFQEIEITRRGPTAQVIPASDRAVCRRSRSAAAG